MGGFTLSHQVQFCLPYVTYRPTFYSSPAMAGSRQAKEDKEYMKPLASPLTIINSGNGGKRSSYPGIFSNLFIPAFILFYFFPPPHRRTKHKTTTQTFHL